MGVDHFFFRRLLHRALAGLRASALLFGGHRVRSLRKRPPFTT